MKRYLLFFGLLLSVSVIFAQRQFECGAAYLSAGGNQFTDIYRLYISDDGLRVQPSLLLTVKGYKVNGIGFRRQDGFLYALSDAQNSDKTTSIYRIDADGNVTELARLPFDSKYSYYAADVSPDGRYYTVLGNSSTPAIFYVVDLLSPTYAYKTVVLPGTNIAAPDIAYDASLSRLYVEDNNSKELLVIDLNQGIIAERHPSSFSGSLLFSGMFGFDCALFGYVRSSSSFIRIETQGKTRPIGQAIALNSTTFASNAGIDACACPQSVKFHKKAYKTPQTDTCSRDYTFTFVLDNECNEVQQNIDFSDIFPSDFSIKSVDRQPFGGTVQFMPGGQKLNIKGMNIAARKDSIVVRATLALNYSDSIYKNQAILRNLQYPGGAKYNQVSDNPITIKANDSTVLRAPLLIKFNRDTISLCENGDITLRPIAKGDALQFRWNTGATTPTIDVNQPALYIVTVTTGCFRSIDTQVVVKRPLRVNIGPDVTIAPGDSVIYTPDYQHYNPLTLKKWTFTKDANLKCINCFNNLAKPLAAQTMVKLRLEDDLGCMTEDEANITIRRNIYVPNSFSPNDDGYNDRFIINTERPAKFIVLEIYNRFGDKVYLSDNQCFTNMYECAWNGDFKGIAQKADIFTYRAVIDFGDGVPFEYKGNIALVR